MNRKFFWNEEKEHLLIECVKKHKDLKIKKWNRILNEMQDKCSENISISILKNKWNVICKKFRDSKLLLNSSGAGTISRNVFPSEVFEEFVENHPNASINLNNYEELSDILNKKVATGKNAITVEKLFELEEIKVPEGKISTKHKKHLSAFEEELLKYLKSEQKDKINYIEKSIAILESLEFTEIEYFKAVDVLVKDDNALAFYFLPESKRKQFIINKIN